MKNEYTITKDIVMSWAKEYPLYNAVSIIVFILWCIVGVGSILSLIMFAVGGGDFFYLFISFVFLFLAVYHLFFYRKIIWSRRFEMLSKTYGVRSWTRTTEFAENEIILTDHSSVTRFKYKNIVKIKEKGNLIMIFLNDNLVIRLYKDAFVTGSWNECREKINSMLK